MVSTVAIFVHRNRSPIVTGTAESAIAQEVYHNKVTVSRVYLAQLSPELFYIFGIRFPTRNRQIHYRVEM
jgi:hypothetical protein